MPRLSKVTKELNVGLQTCVDFLQKKGHTVENSLNAKITDEQYELLVIQFSSDKDLRQKAEKAQRERLDNRKEAKPTVSVEEPKMETLKNEDSKEMFDIMKEVLKEENIENIKFTNRLKNHPVCLTTEGALSLEMEKVLNALPNDNQVKAKMVMEINESHPIAEKLKTLYKDNKEELQKYTKILYSQARLIEGLPLTNPTEISNLICDILSN